MHEDTTSPGESPFVQRRARLIASLTAAVSADERIDALWLQGSLADGTDDPESDIDAYLAVRDDAYDALDGARREFVQRLASVLAYAESPALHAVHCVLDGPIKLDLFFERASEVAARVRPAVRLLLDKAGVGARLRTGWQPSPEETARTVETWFRGTFQGATWPVRLLRRGQLATFVLTELSLVNDTLVALMAARSDPRHLFRNRFSVPRLLTPEQRELLESLGAEVVRAAADRDRAAMLAAHLRILDTLYREGRATYRALGLPYPLSDDAEAALRAFYPREWPR